MNWGGSFSLKKTQKTNGEHPLWKTPEIAGKTRFPGIPGKFSSLRLTTGQNANCKSNPMKTYMTIHWKALQKHFLVALFVLVTEIFSGEKLL
jgi:hypothetical protein